MADRATLHRSKIEDFKEWLNCNGYIVMEPKGDYEILRWRGRPGKPMPIIYDRHKGDHFTANDSATPLVRTFIKVNRIKG